MVVDEEFTRDWYGALPEAFRALDNGDLYGFLRCLGDIAGGLALTVDVLEGLGSLRPITLPGGVVLRLAGEVTAQTVADDGAVIPLAAPATAMDPDDAGVLVITNDDWQLADLATAPRQWLPWLAQSLSVPVQTVPVGHQRAWLADPASRRAGSRPAILAALAWHVDTSGHPPLYVTNGVWNKTVEVPAETVITSVGEAQAAVDAVTPAGMTVTVLVI